MTQKDLFSVVGAPLANPRWSWGAVHPDGVVVLRVWQDEVKRRDGTVLVKVTYKDKSHSDEVTDSPGYRERQQHVELIRQGAVAFLVMCQAKDVMASPRKVKDFERENVFRAGALVEVAGEYWIGLGTRIPVHEAAKH